MPEEAEAGVESYKPEIGVASAEDGLGIVLRIVNPSPVPIAVFEPHPHTSVQLYDARGQPWPMYRGVFAANPRWQVTVPLGAVYHGVIILPPFFIAARGAFEAVCAVRHRSGNSAEELVVRGPVRLALPAVEDYHSEAWAAYRLGL